MASITVCELLPGDEWLYSDVWHVADVVSNPPYGPWTNVRCACCARWYQYQPDTDVMVRSAVPQ